MFNTVFKVGETVLKNVFSRFPQLDPGARERTLLRVVGTTALRSRKAATLTQK